MFSSILFPGSARIPLQTQPPDCFHDLNLDQIIDPLLQREHEVPLAALYYTLLQTPEQIAYRQDIFRDLYHPDIYGAFSRFSAEIRAAGQIQKQSCSDLHSRDPWRRTELAKGHLLDAAHRYCHAAEQLCSAAAGLPIHSEGLCSFVCFLSSLRDSEAFRQLSDAQEALRNAFQQQQYCMLIKDGIVRVRKYDGEEDLSAQIVQTFQKFRQEDSRDYRQTCSEQPYAEHVEAHILQCLTRIYPELFESLNQFVRQYSAFPDDTVLRFSEEIRFYLGWMEQIRDPVECGLPFCYPRMERQCRHAFWEEGFDLALAQKLGNQIVRSGFRLDAPERISVVTGPNQGGKTTFARSVGQLHYLAALGLYVPGSAAVLQIPDRILTHFEREEALTDLSGKLLDDLQRLRGLLDQATSRSIVIINEIFASTTRCDAEKLGCHMMDALARRGCLAVIVTFLDSLAGHGPETVSLMSTVAPDHPGIRTFRIIRKPPDGLAYAMTLAEQHGLTEAQILRRIQP